MDQEIKCKCGEIFLFTVRDQEFYADRNFEAPKRCKSCRQIKKQQRANDVMDN